MPTTIVVYLLPFAYSILQDTINKAKPSKTVDVYAKSPPFSFPASYLLILTYIMSAYLVSFLLFISGFVSSTLVVNPWDSRFFPLKVV